MSKTYLKWCPDGCGKKVYYDKSLRKYICMKCNKEFTKEEL